MRLFYANQLGYLFRVAFFMQLFFTIFLRESLFLPFIKNQARYGHVHLVGRYNSDIRIFVTITPVSAIDPPTEHVFQFPREFTLDKAFGSFSGGRSLFFPLKRRR